MFLIMFKTGHALPLVGTRLLRPRIGRGGDAECPRGVAGLWPVTRRIRVPDSAVNRTRTQTVRGCGQFVSSFNPCQQARPQILRDFRKASVLVVPGQTTVTATNYSPSVREPEFSTSAGNSHSRNVQAPRLSAQWLHRRIVAFISSPINFPVRIQNVSGL
jgi:hypothetical protein